MLKANRNSKMVKESFKKMNNDRLNLKEGGIFLTPQNKFVVVLKTQIGNTYRYRSVRQFNTIQEAEVFYKQNVC